MSTYASLTDGNYYLIREAADEEILLVQVLFESEQCVLLATYGDEDITFWRKKTEPLAELIEELSEEKGEEYEELFRDLYDDETAWEEIDDQKEEVD